MLLLLFHYHKNRGTMSSGDGKYSVCTIKEELGCLLFGMTSELLLRCVSGKIVSMMVKVSFSGCPVLVGSGQCV